MKILGKAQRTIWREGEAVCIIDQTQLPQRFVTRSLHTLAEMVETIATMRVRGAPLIGVAAAYGVALALREGIALKVACEQLAATRPTAVNLRWALEQMKVGLHSASSTTGVDDASTAFALANDVADADAAACRRIGEHGAGILAERAAELGRSVGEPLQVMTHCNAGFLATVDWGTALAAIYVARERDVPLHVWVSETRPRSQGMLTAWELAAAGVPHTIVADNLCGHLLQNGRVDLCIVGSDRTAANGDVCNKIGTYMKAECARAAGVPFYVALPRSTIDMSLPNGAAIPIESRSEDEVHVVAGVRVSPEGSRALNLGFDVTPARLVTALISEDGICRPSELRSFTARLAERSGARTTDSRRSEVEGVVKFTSVHEPASLPEDTLGPLQTLLVAREMLFRLGVLGQDVLRYDGAGFGNVSVRLDAHRFLVSGTQTSGAHPARAEDFCVVEGQDCARNEVHSRGPCPPSSESLTHAMLYAVAPRIGCVLHGHCPEIWHHAVALGTLNTAADVPYGTLHMADAVKALHDAGTLGGEGVLCMLGHEDGVIAYAATPARAANLFFTTLSRALALA